jgi:hypothetical protein
LGYVAVVEEQLVAPLDLIAQEIARLVVPDAIPMFRGIRAAF